ncbi:NmrA family NAD(P)-binding protein [Candidatus Sumerlaeota bacterium]|nr:NmrA family NAD(P)-binding protein [Candidatus Sumerlaeota bacterium]
MSNPELNIVTGAFGFTGRYITRRLLKMGKRVVTLTRHPEVLNPFGNRVVSVPFNFDNPDKLVKSLEGATTLYNTYWIRFEYRESTFEKAVRNSRILIRAALEAGVRRFVHFSVTNASEDSSLPYFRGKALVEKAIMDSRLSYAIIRPALIFGQGDILINNIAWLLRRFPVFAIPGNGEYQLEPIFVEDVAELAVNVAQSEGNLVVDAVGPERYTFEELIRLLAEKIGSKARIIHLSPPLALMLSKLIGIIVNDVILTRDELNGLMWNLLTSDKPPKGHTRLSKWLTQNAGRLGRSYTSELNRHFL